MAQNYMVWVSLTISIHTVFTTLSIHSTEQKDIVLGNYETVLVNMKH